MPTYKGFTATIYDAETSLPLPEYSPTINQMTDIATSYIETMENQPFTIVLRDTINTFSQGTAVYVDGVYVDNGLTGPGIATERRWFGKRVDHIHVKPFIFRRNPSDGTVFGNAQVGTISLILRRCQIGGMAEDQTNRGCVPNDMAPPDVRNIENREDYLAHRAEYRSPQAIPATLYHVRWIDPQNGPAFVEFKFIYRSREVLIAKGIIPAPLPSGHPSLIESPTKKRKLKDEAGKKRHSKKNEHALFSSHTATASPLSSPSKSRPAKKAKFAFTKAQVKKELVTPSTEERSPLASMASDAPSSPLAAIMQRRQSTPHHAVSSNVLPWIESQSANMEVPFDVLRELRELRDEVKRLRQAQHAASQILPAYPGMNPYLALTGHAPTPPIDGTKQNWDVYKDVNSGEKDVHSTDERTTKSQ